jgi:hypothetical protein
MLAVSCRGIITVSEMMGMIGITSWYILLYCHGYVTIAFLFVYCIICLVVLCIRIVRR